MGTTTDRLRTAAEDLLLEKGQAATTLRDITERAGANVAAVNYHFESKDALLALVFREALEEVTEVGRVWLAPALDPHAPDPREARLWSIIARGMMERAPGLLAATASVRDVVD